MIELKDTSEIPNCKNLATQKEKTKGYSQYPNYLFDLDISSGALLVFINLIRRANRKNGRSCFPSLKKIGEDCNIKSENTIRKAIRELDSKDLIDIKKVGRKNIYVIQEDIYIAIDKTNKIYRDNNKMEGTPSKYEGVKHFNDLENETPSIIDAIPSNSEPEWRERFKA